VRGTKEKQGFVAHRNCTSREFLGGARGAATFATIRATGRNENARVHNILHSILQFREDRCNLIL
jgi:hypothetical protein